MSDRIEAEILDVLGEEVAASVDTPIVVIEGTKGDPGKDGITPTIGPNGNWYLGEEDTGKPSRGATGTPGAAGHSPVVTATKSGKTTTISVDGADIATVEDGKDGAPGARGADGITPHIGDNGHWYLGSTDTGKPSRGDTGAAGKSAYQAAVEGGYTKTEAEFAEKLAQEPLIGTTNDLTPTQVYNAVSAGIPVKVQYTHHTYGVISFTAFTVSESLNMIASNMIAYYSGIYILVELVGNVSRNTWGYTDTTLAQKADIPSVLPNPNALTIKIGSTTVTYDGSEAKTVEISDGTEVSY